MTCKCSGIRAMPSISCPVHDPRIHNEHRPQGDTRMHTETVTATDPDLTYRAATDREKVAYTSGHMTFPTAIETDEGLLIGEKSCQMHADRTFQGRVRSHEDGTFSLIGLSRDDLGKINDALGNEMTQQNVYAHGSQPHWWNDLGDGGDHRIWFLSWVDYFAGARAVIEKALAR